MVYELRMTVSLFQVALMVGNIVHSRDKHQCDHYHHILMNKTIIARCKIGIVQALVFVYLDYCLCTFNIT